jgi:uncharacterized membrane protein (TIGR02234 family)
MTRIAQLLLALAALALWVGSRLPWVTVSSSDGLGQPKTTTLSGSDWSTALIPLALLVLAAAVATLAVRGWALRLLAILLAAASALTGYLGIGSWAVRDVSVRAAELAEVPITALVGAQRHHWGAVLTLVAAVFTLVAAVLLLRSAVRAGAAPTKYAAPATRRAVAAQEGLVDGETGDGMSERMIWDALDEGRDPTTEHTEGR